MLICRRILHEMPLELISTTSFHFFSSKFLKLDITDELTPSDQQFIAEFVVISEELFFHFLSQISRIFPTRKVFSKQKTTSSIANNFWSINNELISSSNNFLNKNFINKENLFIFLIFFSGFWVVLANGDGKFFNLMSERLSVNDVDGRWMNTHCQMESLEQFTRKYHLWTNTL